MNILRFALIFSLYFALGCGEPVLDESNNPLNGNWVGEGQVEQSLKQGNKTTYKCGQMLYKIKADLTTLAIAKREFSCLGRLIRLESVEFRIFAKKIYYKNLAVGEVYETGFTVNYNINQQLGQESYIFLNFNDFNVTIVEEHKKNFESVRTFTQVKKTNPEDGEIIN